MRTFALAVETLESGVAPLLVKVTVVLLLALLTTWCMQRSSAARRHYVWNVALTGTLALAVFEFTVPSLRVRVSSESMFAGFARALSGTTGTRATEAQPRGDAGGDSAAPYLLNPATAAVAGEYVRAKTQTITNETNPASGIARGPGVATAVTPRSFVPIVGANDARANETLQVASLRESRSFIARFVVTHQWTLVALCAWLVGAGFVLLRLAVAHARLKVVLGRCRDVHDQEWLHDLKSESRRLQVVRSVRLLMHHDVYTPFTAGCLRPVILLPLAASSWSAERRRAVLAHELAHVARGDYFAQLRGTLACATYWFHPMTWIAARHLRSEGERAADDSVVASGMSAVQYASQLLTLAESSGSVRETPSVALGFARPSQLEWRLRAMLDTSRSRATFAAPLSRTTTVAVILALLPFAALRTDVYAATPAQTSRAQAVQQPPATAKAHATEQDSAAAATRARRELSATKKAVAVAAARARRADGMTQGADSTKRLQRIVIDRADSTKPRLRIVYDTMQSRTADSIRGRWYVTADSTSRIPRKAQRLGDMRDTLYWKPTAGRGTAKNSLIPRKPVAERDTSVLQFGSAPNGSGVPLRYNRPIPDPNTIMTQQLRAQKAYQDGKLQTANGAVWKSAPRDSVFDHTVDADASAQFNMSIASAGTVTLHYWNEPRVRVRAAASNGNWTNNQITLEHSNGSVSLMVRTGALARRMQPHFDVWMPPNTNVNVAKVPLVLGDSLYSYKVYSSDSAQASRRAFGAADMKLYVDSNGVMRARTARVAADSAQRYVYGTARGGRGGVADSMRSGGSQRVYYATEPRLVDIAALQGFGNILCGAITIVEVEAGLRGRLSCPNSLGFDNKPQLEEMLRSRRARVDSSGKMKPIFIVDGKVLPDTLAR